jgi:hypothetical protein
MVQQGLEHPSIMVTLDIRENLFPSEDGAVPGMECALLRQACAMAVAATGGGVQAPGWPRKYAAHQSSPNAPQRADGSSRVRLRGKSTRRDARQTSVVMDCDDRASRRLKTTSHLGSVGPRNEENPASSAGASRRWKPRPTPKQLGAVTPVVPKGVVATVTAALMIRNRWSAIYTRGGRRDSVEAHSALLWTAFFGAV